MGGHEALTYTKVSECTKWRWGRDLLNGIELLIPSDPFLDFFPLTVHYPFRFSGRLGLEPDSSPLYFYKLSR
jgi:hypothetical protein